MELFSNEPELNRLDELYAFARSKGIEWVNFLDLCFDGGDSVEEAEYYLHNWFAQSSETIDSILDR